MLPLIATLALSQAPLSGSSDDLAEVVTFLRAHGLSDLRGGTYRAIRREATQPFEWGQPKRVNGWLFPGGKFVSQDGLTYAGILHTDPADLVAEVEGESSSSSKGDAFPLETDEVLGRLHAAVLIIAGKTALAQRLSSARPPHDVKASNLAAIRTFVTLRYQQALAAHQAGDDRGAQRVEEGLLSAAQAYVRKSDPEGRYPWWVVAEIRKIAADTARRIASSKIAMPRDELRRLVHQLQDVRVQQNGLPGRAQFVDSATVQHLISFGDRAIDPLLDCVASDRRLTRSASFGQSLIPSLETVETAARTALFELLDVPVFDPRAQNGEVSVERLRTWWQAHRLEARPQRQIDVLADDSQDPTAWSVAAERLFSRPKLPHLFAPPISIGEGLHLPGTNARTAELADLLVRRAEQFGVDRVGYSRGYGTHQAARLAAMLTLLDRSRGLALLKEKTREAGEMVLAHPYESEASEVVGSGFTFRAEHGDPGAWAEYRAWLRRERAQPVRAYWVSHQFRPLIERPREPALRGAAEEMFGPDSPWRPLTMAKAGLRPEEMLVSPLLNLPEVQQGAIELLRDRTEGATLTVYEGHARLRRDDGTEGENYVFSRSDMPPAGTVMRIRYSDLLAERLRSFLGVPLFQIWWPTTQRDEALEKMARTLARGGKLVEFGE